MIGRRTVLAAPLLPLSRRVARARVPAATPYDRLALPWWRARHAQVLTTIRAGLKPDLLLLGDSITQNWERPAFAAAYASFYGGRRVLNLGFKGDATAHLLWRLENGEISGIAPRGGVLLIGANNFGALRWSATDTVEGIETVLGSLARRLPAMRVALVGVLPSIRSTWIDQQTALTNGALAERYGRGADERVSWFDLSSLFRDAAGRVDPSRFYDPTLDPPEPALHPTPAAQADMAHAVEPTIASWLATSVN